MQNFYGMRAVTILLILLESRGWGYYTYVTNLQTSCTPGSGPTYVDTPEGCKRMTCQEKVTSLGDGIEVVEWVPVYEPVDWGYCGEQLWRLWHDLEDDGDRYHI